MVQDHSRSSMLTFLRRVNNQLRPRPIPQKPDCINIFFRNNSRRYFDKTVEHKMPQDSSVRWWNHEQNMAVYQWCGQLHRPTLQATVVANLVLLPAYNLTILY